MFMVLYCTMVNFFCLTASQLLGVWAGSPSQQTLSLSHLCLTYAADSGPRPLPPFLPQHSGPDSQPNHSHLCLSLCLRFLYCPQLVTRCWVIEHVRITYMLVMSILFPYSWRDVCELCPASHYRSWNFLSVPCFSHALCLDRCIHLSV